MEQIFTQFVSNPGTLLIGAASLLFIWGCTHALEWAWLRPRRLERELRNQGLNGTAYQFVVGDMKENSKLNKEACAKPMPLSHNITGRVSPLLHQKMKQYGKLSFTWFGPYPRVSIMDPELVREVFYNKAGLLEKPRLILTRLLDDGLISHEGEKWAMHRKILNPAFHVEKLKRMLPAFSTCSHVLVERWQNSVGPDGSFEIDILPEMQNLTGDVISRAAFGSTYEEAKQIFQLQSELTEGLKEAFRNLRNPLTMFLPNKTNNRIKETNRKIRTLLSGMIAKREEGIRKEGVSKDDLLDLMLESNMREKEQSEKSDSSVGMTIDDVIKECKLFYFAGQESTSVLLTWAIVVLSMHPEWQEKAREEVLQHFGKEKPDYDGLSRLKTVTMILYEVLRLYPPVTLITRRICKTMLGNITYPAGVHLAIPVLFIHHDPEIWGPDASEFNPTRFAQGISKATKSDQVAFFPFGAGPRICIGQNFALLEAKMGLSVILQRFKFELSDRYQHAPYTVVTLQTEHGARLNFVKYSFSDFRISRVTRSFCIVNNSATYIKK